MTVPLDVRMAGRIGCQQFPFACHAVTSVLPSGSVVSDTWRPPSSDPRWLPEDRGMRPSRRLEAQPIDPPPMLVPGRQLVIVSLLGYSDIVSFNPDGTVATDLLARCTAEVDVEAGSAPVSAVVTFKRSPATMGGTCSITIEGM